MNPKLAADAYNKISEGYALLALAIEQPAAGVVPPSRALAPVDDLPPLLDDYGQPVEVVKAPTPIRDQHVENVLGQCPVHQKNWTVKEGGVSKAGKEYGAFWKCGEKDSSTRSGYCDKKPVKSWVDAHPAAA
jgi:hypothetical protein